MPFTFKTEKPSGRFSAFEKPSHYIKLKRKEVGTIDPEIPHTIRLAVEKKDINEDGNPNCTWKYIRLKGTFENIDKAKEFLIENFDKITNQFELHYFND